MLKVDGTDKRQINVARRCCVIWSSGVREYSMHGMLLPAYFVYDTLKYYVHIACCSIVHIMRYNEASSRQRSTKRKDKIKK